MWRRKTGSLWRGGELGTAELSLPWPQAHRRTQQGLLHGQKGCLTLVCSGLILQLALQQTMATIPTGTPQLSRLVSGGAQGQVWSKEAHDKPRAPARRPWLGTAGDATTPFRALTEQCPAGQRPSAGNAALSTASVLLWPRVQWRKWTLNRKQAHSSPHCHCAELCRREAVLDSVRGAALRPSTWARPERVAGAGGGPARAKVLCKGWQGPGAAGRQQARTAWRRWSWMVTRRGRAGWRGQGETSGGS